MALRQTTPDTRTCCLKPHGPRRRDSPSSAVLRARPFSKHASGVRRWNPFHGLFLYYSNHAASLHRLLFRPRGGSHRRGVGQGSSTRLLTARVRVFLKGSYQGPSPQPSPREQPRERGEGGTSGASQMRHPTGAHTRAKRGRRVRGGIGRRWATPCRHGGMLKFSRHLK